MKPISKKDPLTGEYPDRTGDCPEPEDVVAGQKCSIHRVAIAFTDIEKSTPLWEKVPEAMDAGLKIHNEILRRLLAKYGGYEVKTEGDAFMVKFDRARDAVLWCLACQEELYDQKWPETLLNEPEAGRSDDAYLKGLRVRMGVHLGDVRVITDPTTGRMDFFGPIVNRAARISGSAHGGQIIISKAVLDEANIKKSDAILTDLGEHRLKGIEQTERLWQALPGRLSGRNFPPPRTLDPHRTNLPLQQSSFMGRRKDIESLERLFNEGARLVTLLGPGGIGKTRLACRFAAGNLHSYQPGGAWFIDLADAGGLVSILSSVSAALSVPLISGSTEEDGIEQLGKAIAGRGRILLVFDNFEQVVQHGPKTVGCWIAGSADACFLVTSRERLMLEGETVREVAPLSSEDATALFVDRAQAVHPCFSPEEAEMSAIEAIVEQLDGIPLAIELAAARANIMSPSKIRDRLSERFRLLASRVRGKEGRHSTLRSTIDWSWDILTEWEREALAQCSVFRGGWILEAAEAVLDISRWDEAPWMEDTLQALVDKSLVRSLFLPGKGGEMRFGLYESIREYAAGKLADSSGAEARHGDYFAKLGQEETINNLTGPGRSETLRVLETEIENLVEAARRAILRNDSEVAAFAALAASEVFELRGPFDSGISLLKGALEVVSDDKQAVRLGLRRGWLEWLAGRMNDAFATVETALDLAKKIGNRKLEGEALGILGNIHRVQGRVQESLICYKSALAVARETGNRPGEGKMLINHGNLHSQQGRMEEAQMNYEAALEVYSKSGNPLGEGKVLINLGNLNMQQGLMKDAEVNYKAALEIFHNVGDRRSEGIMVGNLGILEMQQGRMEEARIYFETALLVHREVGNRHSEGIVLGNLGNLHSQQGRMEEAQMNYEAALLIHREVGNRRSQGDVLGNLGSLHILQGRMEDARLNYEAALEIHREVGNRRNEGIILGYLGRLHLHHNRMEEAKVNFETALEIMQKIGDHRSKGIFIGEMGKLYLQQGQMEKARKKFDAALEIHRRVQNRLHEGVVLGLSGRLNHAEGSINEARQTFDKGETLLRAVNETVELGKLLCGRARLENAEGDSEKARRILEEAGELAEKAGAGPESELGRLLAETRALLEKHE